MEEKRTVEEKDGRKFYPIENSPSLWFALPAPLYCAEYAGTISSIAGANGLELYRIPELGKFMVRLATMTVYTKKEDGTFHQYHNESEWANDLRLTKIMYPCCNLLLSAWAAALGDMEKN